MIACSTSEMIDRALGLVVDPVQQLAHLRLGEEEAEVLVAAPVHRHPDAVHQRREDDDHLGVLVREPVVAHGRRLDAVLRELAQELERDVDDDLDVHPGVVVDLHPRDGVDVRDVPPRLQLRVVVGAVEDAAQLAVAALGEADAHPGDRLGRGEARLADGLGRDRALDAVLDLGVERRPASARRSSVHRAHPRTRLRSSRVSRIVEPRELAARVRERLAEAGAGWRRR